VTEIRRKERGYSLASIQAPLSSICRGLVGQQLVQQAVEHLDT